MSRYKRGIQHCGAWVVLCLASSCGGRSNSSTQPLPTPPEDEEASCGDDQCTEDEDCPGGGECLDIEWIAIQGGTFSMGSTTGLAKERPVHSVTVASFTIMKREASVLEYRACTDAGACSRPRMSAAGELAPPEYCAWMYDDRGDHPINCIDWNQARDFCRWIGARLPSEAEWEYAARGRGEDISFPWGDSPPTCAFAVMGTEPHFVGCGEERTYSACSKSPGHTAQGLCDMAGSVIEWVEDQGHENYENAPSDGSPWVDSEEPETRIARGGSLATRDPEFLRNTVRFSFDPSLPRYVVGVRCAR